MGRHPLFNHARIPRPVAALAAALLIVTIAQPGPAVGGTAAQGQPVRQTPATASAFYGNPSAGARVASPRLAVALPTNSWLGAKSFAAYSGALAACTLGAAIGTDSAWSAVTGSASLDIVQIGIRLVNGLPRFFAAWGRGEPNARGALYTEVDLGPANLLRHSYGVQLVGPNWNLTIDGVTLRSVPDASFRTWAIRAAQVQNEVQQNEPMGGTVKAPLGCTALRARNGTGWISPAWSLGGAGPSSRTPKMGIGSDWFTTWS